MIHCLHFLVMEMIPCDNGCLGAFGVLSLTSSIKRSPPPVGSST